MPKQLILKGVKMFLLGNRNKTKNYFCCENCGWNGHVLLFKILGCFNSL